MAKNRELLKAALLLHEVAYESPVVGYDGGGTIRGDSPAAKNRSVKRACNLIWDLVVADQPKSVQMENPRKRCIPIFPKKYTHCLRTLCGEYVHGWQQILLFDDKPTCLGCLDLQRKK